MAAEQVAAFAEARGHLERALTVWDDVPDASARISLSRLEILRHAAEDAFLGGDPTGAAALGRRALALVDDRTDPLLAGMLHDRLARYLWDTPDQTDALEIQRRAVELVPSDPPSQARSHVLAGLAGHLMVLGRYAEARRISEEAIEMARTVGAPEAEYTALNTLGTLVCATEDVDAGLDLVGTALLMAEEHGDALEQMRGYWNLFANTFAAARWRTRSSGSRTRPMRSLDSGKPTWCPSWRYQRRTAWFDSVAGTKPIVWCRRPGLGSDPANYRSDCPNWTSLAVTSRRRASSSNGRRRGNRW